MSWRVDRSTLLQRGFLMDPLPGGGCQLRGREPCGCEKERLQSPWVMGLGRPHFSRLNCMPFDLSELPFQP